MATMRSIAANRAMETTATTSTGAYALEGPVAGYEAFRDAIATGRKVAYCVQQATVDGNGDLVSMDYEIGIGTLTHGTPDTLARTQILQSTNGDAAVNWGPGEKTIFSVAPVQLLPMMASALTSGQAGKALVVDPTSRFFEVADLFLKLAGGTMTGALTSLSDNNVMGSQAQHILLRRGDGTGVIGRIITVGDGVNGASALRLNLRNPVGPVNVDWTFDYDGRLTLAADGSNAMDAVTKQQLDLKAPIASPALTGNPTAPTQATSNNSTRIATTAFVKNTQLGWGQTWQDVTGSRAASTSYQNTTGKPISVSVYVGAIGATRALEVSANNSNWVEVANTTTGGGTMQAIVPPDHYYRMNGSFGLWRELR